MNIEELKKQKEEIEAKIKELESRPWEKGMWLISEITNAIMRFDHYATKTRFFATECYGHPKEEYNNIASGGWPVDFFRPATEEEVIEGLKKEAIRRYTGKRVRCLYTSSDVSLFQPKFSSEEREVSLYNWLWISPKEMYIQIYHNGKWADIVENKITIAGYEVEDLGKEVKIGRSIVSKKSIRGFFDVVDTYGWNNVAFYYINCKTDELTALRKLVEK